jgi:hypothetical protein
LSWLYICAEVVWIIWAIWLNFSRITGNSMISSRLSLRGGNDTIQVSDTGHWRGDPWHRRYKGDFQPPSHILLDPDPGQAITDIIFGFGFIGYKLAHITGRDAYSWFHSWARHCWLELVHHSFLVSKG